LGTCVLGALSGVRWESAWGAAGYEVAEENSHSPATTTKTRRGKRTTELSGRMNFGWLKLALHQRNVPAGSLDFGREEVVKKISSRVYYKVNICAKT
jgi:hypothetical protein